jgi:hypothetical protein
MKLNMPAAKRSRPRQTPVRRLTYGLLGIAAVLVAGTLGFHYIAGLSPVDAFYFESMLATGQGPPITLTTDDAKIFASVMAFVSVGSVVTTLLFAVGPIVRRYWREGLERVEDGARTIERDLEREFEGHPPPKRDA